MGFFNFLETFFFISLAITFALILLLVYHFKQRLTNLEEKGDTMFEIINNIVKEISSLKQAFVQRNNMFPAMVPMSQMPTMFNTSVPSPSVVVNTRPIDYAPMHQDEEEDDEDAPEEEEDEDEDEDGEEEEDDEEEDEDEDDEDDDDAVENNDAGISDVNVVPEEHNIKIVKMEINDAEFNPVEEYEPEIEEEEEVVEEQEPEDGLEQEPEPDEHDFDQEPESEEHNLNQESEEPPAIDKESYRKMNLQQLKSMVISKGLSKDANKLKKNELIALLEK